MFVFCVVYLNMMFYSTPLIQGCVLNKSPLLNHPSVSWCPIEPSGSQVLSIGIEHQSLNPNLSRCPTKSPFFRVNFKQITSFLA